MREHVKILGILNIAMSALTALAGIFLLLILGGVGTAITAAGHSGKFPDLENPQIAGPIIGVVGIAIGTFLLALSAPAIIGGIGLLKCRPWSRILMIVVSSLHLLSFPFGTALGIYGLWVLLNEESRRLLESGGAYQAVGYPVAPSYPPAGYAPPPPPA
jgi:hypothetical protein